MLKHASERAKFEIRCAKAVFQSCSWPDGFFVNKDEMNCEMRDVFESELDN